MAKERRVPNTAMIQERVHSSRSVIPKVSLFEIFSFISNTNTTSTGYRCFSNNAGEDVDEKKKDGDEESGTCRVGCGGKEEEDPRGDYDESCGYVVEHDVFRPFVFQVELYPHNGEKS